MKYPWKFVLLLMCVLTVQYIFILYQSQSYHRSCQDSGQFQKCPEKDQLLTSNNTTVHSRKHILIFSKTRSGSSFAGQLFNQHQGIFYLFEPLYHVKLALCNYSMCLQEPSNRVVQVVNIDLLFNLYSCDLYSLEAYIQPEPQNHLTASLFRRTASHALCTPPVCQNDNKETIEGHPDEEWCLSKCQASLNLTLALVACQSRSHVSIKTVRIPKISHLRFITEDPRLDMRIIHLVRDPRAILASRMAVFSEYTAWKVWNDTGRKPHFVDLTPMAETCQDMVDSVNTGLEKPAWLHGRYLLVRYEDLVLNPIEKAKEIYKFLDLDIDPKVLRWISHNTNSGLSTNFKFSTTRVSKSRTENWRLSLSFDVVKTVQGLCNNTLALLGYNLVQSEEELRNMSKTIMKHMPFN